MLFLSVLCCSAVAVAESQTEDRIAQIEALFAPATQSDAPGAAVIVIQGGQVLHKKGYGMANLDRDLPNTSQTIFRIGSITKSFTALAILILHEEGALSIDNHISEYLPDNPHGAKITLRHLLNHTSGISGGENEPLLSNPGDRLNYSNAGYNMLGHIIEKVSGKSYGDYLKETIFAPLGMTNSGYDLNDTRLENRASGYASAGEGKYVNSEDPDMSGPFAAGGIYSTVEDMFLWDQVLYTNKLLKSSTLQEAFTPVTLNDGRKKPYGMGWMINQTRGLKEFGHGGDITGYNSFMKRYPEQKFTVIVLSNVGMRPPGPLPDAGTLSSRIAEIYLSDKMQPAKEATRIQVEVDPKIYDDYVGTYRIQAPPEVISAAGEILTITKEDKRLFGETKMGKVELYPESETVFNVENPPIKHTFVRNDEGKVIEVILSVMELREFRAKKME